MNGVFARLALSSGSALPQPRCDGEPPSAAGSPRPAAAGDARDGRGDAQGVGDVVILDAPQPLFANLAVARDEELVSKRRRQTEAARAAKARKREDAQAAARQHSCMVVASQVCSPLGIVAVAGQRRGAAPRAAGFMSLAVAERKEMSQVKAASMQCLAIMPRIRGKGNEAESKWQQRGACLMASSIQQEQRKCFRMFTERFGFGMEAMAQGDQEARALLAVNVMWDEATQKMRSTLSSRSKRSQSLLGNLKESSMQVSNSTMVSLARFLLDVQSSVGRVAKTEPWVMPLKFFPRADTENVLHCVLSDFPLPLENRAELDPLVRPFDLVFVTCGFDSASSNLKMYKYLLHLADTNLPQNMIVMGEPCIMHQTHIVKASSVSLGGLAAMLYSSSKLIRMNHCLHTMQGSIHDLVEKSLRVDQSPGPQTADENDIMKLALLVFGIDGDQTLLYTCDHRGEKKATRFLQDLRDLCMHVEYDRSEKKWVYHVVTHEEAQRVLRHGETSSRLSFQDSVTVVAMKLQNIMFGKSWPVAALSRWTNIVEALKRSTFGAALGGVFVNALSSLSGRMQLDEAKVQSAVEAASKAMAEGAEVDDTRANHLSRILRVSKFWAQAGMSWQTAVVLITTVTVDRLAQRILGKNHQAITLAELVDPGDSVVAATLAQILKLLTSWDSGGQWGLLEYMEAGAWALDSDIRAFARRQLIAVSCSIFHRLVLRFTQFPYKMQWIISPAVSAEEKDKVCDEFLGMRKECMSWCMRKLQERVPEPEQWKGDYGKHVMEFLQKSLTFSTHPVEVEHKRCKDDLTSATRGSGHSHVGNRTQCRQFRDAFIAKGNDDPLRLGRRRPGPQADGQKALPTGDGLLSLKCAPAATSPDMPRDRGSGAVPEQAVAPVMLPRMSHLDLSKLGGGNPKMMYMNYHMAAESKFRKESVARASGVPLTKEMVTQLRQQLAQAYDGDVTVRERWQQIFHLVKRHRQVAASRAAGEGQAANDQLQLQAGGAGAVDMPGAYKHLPIAPAIMMDHFAEKFKTMRQLDQDSMDDSRYTLQGDAPKRLDGFTWTGGQLFGCGGGPHNVCRHTMPLGDLQAFEKLLTAMSHFVDGLKKTFGKELHLLSIYRDGAEGESDLHTFVVLGQASFNPKFQSFCRCAPDGDGDCEASGMRRRNLPPFPWTLNILRKVSRLCAPSAPVFSDLYHETSDEVCKRLVDEAPGGVWFVRELAYEEVLGSDLLRLRIVGWKGDGKKLEPTARKCVPVDDAFAAWRKRRSSARSAASASPQSSARSQWAVAGAAGAPEGVAEPRDEGAADDEFLGEMLGVLAEVAEVQGALEDICDDMVAEARGESLDGEGTAADQEVDSMDKQAATMAEHVQVLEGDAAGAGASAERADVSGAGSVASAASSSSAAASPPPPPPPAESARRDAPVIGEEVVGGGGAPVVLEVDDKGYAMAVSPPEFRGRMWGRITTWRNNISARCSLHPKCSWAKSTNRVSRQDMVDWLAKGRPVPIGASDEEAKALALQHFLARSA